MLNEIKEKRKNLLRCSKLVFIDNDDTNTVYSFLSKPKSFNIDKNLNFQRSLEQVELGNAEIVKMISETRLVTSVKAGLGKTYEV